MRELRRRLLLRLDGRGRMRFVPCRHAPTEHRLHHVRELRCGLVFGAGLHLVRGVRARCLSTELGFCELRAMRDWHLRECGECNVRKLCCRAALGVGRVRVHPVPRGPIFVELGRCALHELRRGPVHIDNGRSHVFELRGVCSGHFHARDGGVSVPRVCSGLLPEPTCGKKLHVLCSRPIFHGNRGSSLDNLHRLRGGPVFGGGR